MQGSVINAGQIGHLCFISTTVEPSKVNKDKNSYLWVSDGGEYWIQIGAFRKDFFNGTLFQYENIKFPYCNISASDSLYISGQALRKIDGHSVEFQNMKDFIKTKS